MFLRHPDYDTLRKIMDDISNTIKVWADNSLLVLKNGLIIPI